MKKQPKDENALIRSSAAEYMDVFQNEDYVDLVRKLANGVLAMQNADGSYYHVLNFPDFTPKEAYRTVYYDGEATFGLTRAYTFTKDQNYKKHAE
jgi:rhamnogalacturonyl hydrolase YesR